MKKTYVFILSMLLLMGCSQNNTETDEADQAIAAQPTESEISNGLEKLSLTQFIENLKPDMQDTLDEHPTAAGALAYFIDFKGIKLNEINNLPSTTVGKVLKDSYLEKGKSICFKGTIVQISADRSGGFTAYQGIMSDNNLQPFAFIALGETGDLEARSNGTFCGVVISKMSYSNTSGGESTAPYAVGFFDLPINK